MLAANNVKMSGSEKKKVNKNTYDISFIKRVTRKFLEFPVEVVQDNGKEMYKKPNVVYSPFSLPSPLSITRFYILFEQTINIIESFAQFIPG